MVRIKRGNVARKRRKKVLSLAKGFRGTHSRLFRVSNQQVMKALRYSYIGRKQKKRQFRRLWITRINASTRSTSNLTYSRFMNKVKTSNIALNRCRIWRYWRNRSFNGWAVRGRPSLAEPVLFTLPQRASFVVLREKGDWVELQYRLLNGFQ